MINKERQFMLRAIELARKAKGKTFPNPLVGAVVVKNGKIIGQGYHKKAGTPHAEIIALRKAEKGIKKNGLKKSMLFVTLEPCAHYGKTPPCTDSIIKSGIKKVYAAMTDPNPLVRGLGMAILRKNGIKTKVGICRREARDLNASYIESVKKTKEGKQCLQVLSKIRAA